MRQKYNVTERQNTNFLKLKDFEAGDMILENPSEFLEYTEKEMVTKKGKKFTAKTYIFKDTETGARVGVPATGLLTYFMNEYQKGDVIQLRYDGKDDPEDNMSPHQLTVFECSLADGAEIDPSKVKAVQDAMEDEDDDEEL